MRLSKLYSNQSDLFDPVDFQPGLNVVLAEIRLAENRAKDTHNLGKTTLGRLIDFCLLLGKDPKFFLFKHFEQFKNFVFFLEIALDDVSYITIRRSVEDASKISFKKHSAAHQDFSTIRDLDWTHDRISFERAKELLDGILDWRELKPWPFRMGLGYLLRTQDDFRNVFQLRKFMSKHSDWKPFLSQLLGFDSQLLNEHYETEESLLELQAQEKIINHELGGSLEDISKIEGMLLLKHREVDRKQDLLNAFDFRSQDMEQTKKLVEEIDARISTLNKLRYSLAHNRNRINSSLEEDQVLFDPDSAQQLFEEAGVEFKGQIKKDFEQLIAFNKAITLERRSYLKEELEEIDVESRRVNSELDELGQRRSDALSFLSSKDVFEKYRLVSNDLVGLRADIVALERQRGFIHRLQELRSHIRGLTEKYSQLQTRIEANVESQNTDKDSLFSKIRVFFSEIVEEVIDRKALLSVASNKEGHLEFRAEILDESGNATSADLGHTYRKLLCMAFDLAVLRAHSNVSFPRFVFHDGALEALDDRKKINLLGVMRRYAGLGLQPIITLIDSDLPSQADTRQVFFSQDEIVVLLHDEDESGRLFKMPTW